MLSDPALRKERFNQLARSTGKFAILAIDQRESLRSLLVQAGRPSSDADVTSFKIDVTRHLSPFASAALVDPLYGLRPVLDDHALAPGCGLIVAADRLHQEPGEPVQASDFDLTLPLNEFVELGAAAFKFLVLWRADESPEERTRMVRAFVERCRAVGVLSVVEGIVRPPEGTSADWNRDAAVVAAAHEFGALGPDLYKAEIPTLGRGRASNIERISADISAALPCPWVVLSAGVDAERFPDAVASACHGGASGFLAGRGIWGPSVASTDPASDLAGRAAQRLRELVAIVDAEARRWDT